MLTTKSPYFIPLTSRPAARVRLLCIPFAGGSAAVYHGLARGVDERIEVVSVELPGHGTRFTEPLVQDLSIVADAIASEIVRWRDLPLALFGYSNGSLIAFEVMRRLTAACLQRLEHCFLCARGAPQFPDHERAIHRLPDAEFLAVIRSYDGTPPEVIEDPELLAMFLPILKADFAMSGDYVFKPLAAPLPVSATLIGGRRDAFVPLEKLKGWGEHFESVEEVAWLEGGHFFLQTQEKTIAGLINRRLLGAATVVEI